ncbi:alanine racemase [Bacillus sp. PS06]|uniref:alanine racemase n=1 Tax=Bacillus sp. PS06 TaxID=2764176 RepID=UPI001783A72B|nr:alanine racemase [Bacillus sp. PS06]MBD8070870.1 alanine racemase [Bacillus sp. PS06]
METGQLIKELDTPSLLLDLDKLQANIDDMTTFAVENQLVLRPHIKTHKSVRLANMQVEAGAIGITVAKLSEAEVMAAGGITDILVAYPISKKQKIERIKGLLAKGVKLKIAVDHIDQLKELQQELESSPYILEVWIKVNSGLNRCGVEPKEEVVKLAQAILFLSKLRLGGIFTHAGHSYAAKTTEEIQQIAIQEANAVVDSAQECERMGIPIPVRSVGSTPTYKLAGVIEGINEVRPGNAAFFDSIQVGLGVTSIEKCALSVLASVVGVYKDRVVFDSGSKTLCLDKGAHGNETVRGFGTVIGHPEIEIERLSEEHGVGIFTSPSTLKRNDIVEIIPNHACTVVNQFNHYIVHQKGIVVDIWNVDARGMNQ